MASGIWPAVSGATAKAQALDVVANNLANVDTLGFKKDQPAFKEYLATLEREQTGAGIPRAPYKDKDLHPLDGRDQSFVVMDGTYTNFRPGNLIVTHAPLDLALDGPGFLEVSTPSGVRYTRQGSLKMAMDGRLVTTEGFPVLASGASGQAAAQPVTAVQPSQGGQTTQGGVAAGPLTGGVPPDVVARFINIGDSKGKVSISESGEIYAGEELVAKLAVTDLVDTTKLRKAGNALFELMDPKAIAPPNVQGQTRVRQGVLETSNVNPVEEMTQLIKANRLFEHDLRAIKTYDDLFNKEANEVGKL